MVDSSLTMDYAARGESQPVGSAVKAVLGAQLVYATGDRPIEPGSVMLRQLSDLQSVPPLRGGQIHLQAWPNT